MPIRIYTSQPLTPGLQVTLESSPSHHLSQVLRQRIGSSLHLFNGDGSDFSAHITQVDKKFVTVQVDRLFSTQPPSALSFSLYIGISRGERMDFALQKAVELGVDKITPLFTERTVVKLQGSRLVRKMDHWQKIVISACEQSGRNYLPQLEPAMALKSLYSHQLPGTSLLLDHQSERSLNQVKKPDRYVNLLIGPEGGISESEQQCLCDNGFITTRLGPRVLRTETAPLAALAAMQILWGDFRDAD